VKLPSGNIFSLFDRESIVHVKCLKNKNNLPPQEALRRVRKYIKMEGLQKRDMAWLVVDKDSWNENDLQELHVWQEGHSNYGFALSNPKFEYWLLLHFEDADGVATSKDCDNRLSKYLPEYHKHIKSQHFSVDKIRTAVERAKGRNTPPCKDWPRRPGTTVYKLVENILQSGSNNPSNT
jgi:hypothetical protein